jgi:hypothetical protein
MLWICKGFLVSRLHCREAFPLALDNEPVSGESSDQAATTPLGRKSQWTLDSRKFPIQVLQFCPLAGADLLDLAFYNNHIALSLNLEDSGLSTMSHGTDQKL